MSWRNAGFNPCHPLRVAGQRRPRYRCVTENPYLENNEVQELAREYNLKAGFPGPLPTPYAKVPEATLRKIARLFDESPDQSGDAEVRRAYAQFIKEVKAQWRLLPYLVEPFGDGVVPYKDSPAMMDDLLKHQHLWVYDGGEDHTLMTRRENFMFRAVHDVIGHAQFGFAFGPRGEYNAFQEHCKLFSPLARIALASETIGQNAWVNFGPNAHLPVTERPFAEQKAVLLPPEYRTTPDLQRAYSDFPAFFPPV